MSNKTISIISYITIIGWIIAYVSYNNSAVKGSLAKFHLKQALGIAILGIAFSIVLTIIGVALPGLASFLGLANIGILILWILGIINASNEHEIPVPVVGSLFTDKFDFIK
jgi:uncharacterized membrane protein